MIKINSITKGSKVQTTQEFIISKVNKKSIVLSDSKGNTTIVRDKDFGKYTTTGTTSGTTTAPLTGSLKGRMPKWANSTPKIDFVKAERGEGRSATTASYKEFRGFQKQLRNNS